MSSYSQIIFFTGVILFLCSCEDNSTDRILLEGKIGGKEWRYKYAKSTFNNLTDVYDTQLFGIEQVEELPCQISFSDKSFIKTEFNNAEGFYQVPADIEVIFEQPGADNLSFSATYGYVEITSISGGRIAGFIEAGYDDDNAVSGDFIFDRCR